MNESSEYRTIHQERKDRSGKAEKNRPVGEGAAEYAGPSLGPFNCGHCIHFDDGRCDHPVVIAGPTKGRVEAGGCCKYQRGN